MHAMATHASCKSGVLKYQKSNAIPHCQQMHRAIQIKPVLEVSLLNVVMHSIHEELFVFAGL